MLVGQMKTALLEILGNMGTQCPNSILRTFRSDSPVQKNTTQTGSSSSPRKAPAPLSRSHRGDAGGICPPKMRRSHTVFPPTRSGSAFPATLAFQIRDLERETSRALTLDAIVTVIDAENFSGYEDTSITARMQAQYTDVLLIVSSPVPAPPPSPISPF